jgi:hypothetical protein
MAQTPVPTASWQAGGNLSNSSGFPADTQIAVSEKSVVVTARAVIAFYDKAGAPLQPPIATQSFFSSLNLVASFGIDSYYDTRAIFDPYRKRFWICALTFNSAHQNDTARRDMVVMAVSKTQNPLDGWFLYYWDAVAHYGVPKDPVYQPGDSADYPCLGIDKRCIYQTNAVIDAVTGTFRYVRVVLYDADTLASGSPNAKGWQFWDLTNPDSSLARIVQPAVHHSESSRAYFVGQHGDQLLVWGLSNPLEANQKMERADVTLSAFTSPPEGPQKDSKKPVKMSNLINWPLKAVYRSGSVYTVMNDGRDWFKDNQPMTAIRLVRVNVKEFPKIPTSPTSGFINRIFGANNPLEDPPETRLSYGWPCMEVNKNGDMAIVYTRTGTTRYPEMRYSAYLAAESDIRPSRLVKIGEAPYDQTLPTKPQIVFWGDLAGASVDPADDTAIWVAHQYASKTAGNAGNGNFQIWVAKVFA